MKKRTYTLVFKMAVLLFFAADLQVSAQIDIFEPCTNNTAVNSNVIIDGDAYFTSGVDDPSGLGYLRLTKKYRISSRECVHKSSLSFQRGRSD